MLTVLRDSHIKDLMQATKVTQSYVSLFYFAGLTCDKCSLILLCDITAGIKPPILLQCVLQLMALNLSPLNCRRGYFSII